MKKIKATLYFIVIVFISLLFPRFTSAQDNNFKVSYRSSIYGSTQGSLPFWFVSNVNGKVDPNSTNFLNELGFSQNIYQGFNLGVSAGSNLVFRLSQEKSIHASELFVSLNYHAFQLDVGRFNQPIGLNNHALTIGSMMMSTNAIPVTRISIHNPKFVPVPFTNDVVEYKGMFTHGWFNEDRYVDDVFLHQKYLYLKFNIGEFAAIGGIVHNALWGGTSENPNVGSLPQSFSDYLRVITGSSADPESDAPGGEISNTLGNSIAAYEFGAEYEFEETTLTLTRLFYLEDGVSRRFRSPWDGVWGLNIKFEEADQLVQALTYEHINTRRQDSRSFQARGRANYYNHFLYRSGWSNYDRVLGMPLITYNAETGRINNNILVGHHLGLKGTMMSGLEYKIYATYSRNYGIVGGKVPPETIDFPSRRQDQYSFLLNINYAIPTLDDFVLHVSLASDVGELYEDRLGGMVGINWSLR